MIEFTTKQIAELLSVSKPTVQKAINELAIQPERKDNNNRGYYSYADTVAIIKAVKPSFDFSLLSEFGEKSQNGTAKPQNETTNTAKPQNLAQNPEEQTEKPPNEQLEFMRSMLSVIQEQLKEKDKQLEIKDKQIQDLSDRLAEAMQLTRGQQYITAADKTTELLEADAKKERQAEHVVEDRPAAAAVNPAPAANETNIEAAQEENTKQKKSFWKRLFGR